MIQINLTNDPNQSLEYHTNNAKYQFEFKVTEYGVIYSISINDNPSLSGFRLQPYIPLIPYKHLESDLDGNFILVTNQKENPDYKKFNISQFLIHLTMDELIRFKRNGKTR